MGSTKREKAIRPDIMDEIVQAVTKLDYGELTITVHDSRIVQIETKEKRRF